MTEAAQWVERLDAGNNDAALAQLRECQAALQGYGASQEIQEALITLEHIASQIEQGAWGARARKGSQYRAASLCKMSSRDLWCADEAAPSFKKPEPPAPTPPAQTPPGQQPPTDNQQSS